MISLRTNAKLYSLHGPTTTAEGPIKRCRGTRTPQRVGPGEPSETRRLRTGCEPCELFRLLTDYSQSPFTIRGQLGRPALGQFLKGLMSPKKSRLAKIETESNGAAAKSKTKAAQARS